MYNWLFFLFFLDYIAHSVSEENHTVIWSSFKMSNTSSVGCEVSSGVTYNLITLSYPQMRNYAGVNIESPLN